MIPLPPPVSGVPFDLETAAGRVTGYLLGEGRTVLLLHSFNAAGSAIEIAPLASRLAKHRRVVLVDWLGFGTSDRPDAPYGWALYGEQLERIRLAALQPGETSVDVVALSLPGQYVVVAAADHPQRVGRIVLISPTGFGRFKGSAGRSNHLRGSYLAHSMGSGERHSPAGSSSSPQLRADGEACRRGADRVPRRSGRRFGRPLPPPGQPPPTGAELAAHGLPVTELRAAVIIGSGSASFEILRHLTERLPIMITPAGWGPVASRSGSPTCSTTSSARSITRR